jgi:hypothetical protein
MTPSVSPDREERQSAVLETTVSSYTGDVETYVGKLTGRVHRSGRGPHLGPRTFLAVDVVNGEDVPVDIVIQTPGKELTRLFPARATTLPARDVIVTATGPLVLAPLDGPGVPRHGTDVRT